MHVFTTGLPITHYLYAYVGYIPIRDAACIVMKQMDDAFQRYVTAALTLDWISSARVRECHTGRLSEPRVTVRRLATLTRSKGTETATSMWSHLKLTP